MRHVGAILLHVVACGCLGAQPPPGQAPERWMQANATRPLSRAAATPSRRSAMMAQESSQPLGARPVARPVARPASGNASALDPHTKLKSEHRAELVERLPRHVEKGSELSGLAQLAPSGLPRAMPALPSTHRRRVQRSGRRRLFQKRPSSERPPLGTVFTPRLLDAGLYPYAYPYPLALALALALALTSQVSQGRGQGRADPRGGDGGAAWAPREGQP